MLPVEIVVRGYLAGSGWTDYLETGAICGTPLPPGLRESDRLPEPIVTPATKATEGHDLNITETEAEELCGRDAVSRGARGGARALRLRRTRMPRQRGILLADTKFELGVDADGRVTLADEALTPDSSRFWPAAELRARAARSRRSTSSTCATGASRRAGTEPRRARSSRPTSSTARGRATSRRSSCSPGSRSTRYLDDPEVVL